MRIDDLSLSCIASTAFFTGHRRLSREELARLPALILQCVSDAYDAGYRRFFCGCALGFDTQAALQTVRFRETHPDTVLLLAIPCADQSDRWTGPDREVYRRILSLADDRIVLSPAYYRGAMLTRNRYMADRSSLCICYMTHWKGGTASAVRYAMAREPMRIVNLAAGNTEPDLLREDRWNYTFISPSAGRNAATAPLLLSRGRKLSMKHIRTSC